MALNIKKDLTKVNYSKGRNSKVKYIVIHWTGNKNDTAANNANYFRSTKRNASAHYFVDNKEIVQVVEDHNAAWHVGDGKGRYGITNNNSIGIELCGTNGGIGEPTILQALELVTMLMKKYGVPLEGVVRHWDASRKTCPWPWYENGAWTKWTIFKDRLENFMSPSHKKTVKVSINGVTHTIKGEMKESVNYVSVREIAELLGYTVDWDNDTRTVLISK